jgi:predicted MFS family arabinose efflux permease
MTVLFTCAVTTPLAAIFAMQSALTMGAYAFPVVIPVAALDLGIAPESVGFFVATIYIVAMLVGLYSGRVLVQLGPTRLFQVLLGLSAAGALALTLGSVWSVILAAVLVGCSTGPMNPSGSQVLARVASPDTRALIFSLKQCATPTGGILAGAILPALILAYDWRMAMLAVAAFVAVMVVVAPFGRLGRKDEIVPGEEPASPMQALRAVLTDGSLRAVTITGFGLALCQMGLATYLIVFLWREAGYSPAEAGFIFAVLHIAGIISRVFLGLIADRLLSARLVLALIGITLSLAFLAIPHLTAAWPIAAVYGVVAVAGASGNGWVGLYFAELARLAPEDRVAEVAAGSQFVTYLGIVCGPLIFGSLLQATDSYLICFNVLAVVAMVSALLSLLKKQPSPAVPE